MAYKSDMTCDVIYETISDTKAKMPFLVAYVNYNLRFHKKKKNKDI